MDTLSVDASVFVKWYASEQEEDLEQARALYENLQRHKIRVLTSDLLIFELSNALLKGKGLGEAEVKEALQIFFETPVEIVPTDAALIDETIGIAARYQLTTYDAVYVAVARRFGCRLLTANPRCHSKVRDGTVLLLSEFRA
jgi:predicted nucleic acid-binding protein